MLNDDDDLRKRFAELKAHDARTAPSFEETKAAARARKPSALRMIIPIAASLAAAAVILLFLTQPRPPNSASSPYRAKGGEGAAVVAMVRHPALTDPMPLDFLLDTSLDGDQRARVTNTGTPNPIRGW